MRSNLYMNTLVALWGRRSFILPKSDRPRMRWVISVWKISYIIFFVCIKNNLNIILNFPCYCYVIFDTLKTVLRILWITKRMFISCYRLILPLRVNTIGHFLFLNHAMNALNYSNIHVYGMSRQDVYSPSTTSMYHRP